MHRMKSWPARIWCLGIVYAGFLGLTLVPVPLVNTVHAATAVNIGAADALTKLEKQIEALPDSAFKNRNNREALLNKIDAVFSQIENGAYQGAIKKLENDIEDKIWKWVVASEKPELIERVEIAIAAAYNASETTVTTLYGEMAGADAGNNSWVWKGVPYARPPVGDLRWKAPRNPDPWKGVRHSTDTFTPCTQPVMSPMWIPANQITGSEDCLYVNVFRPKTKVMDLPVYLWIHGGANYFGGAHNYDGSIIASRSNMVVVVIQYRLGPFGWFTHPALNPGGTAEDVSGNYGTLDTIQALKWVHNNIAFFGGNPGNVTVAGQSAGGFNTTNLMISLLASGLFHKAIIESAGGGNIPVSIGVTRANTAIDKLLVADGTCPNLAAAAAYRGTMTNAQIEAYLRGKTANEIERAVMNDRGSIDNISPFIDGIVVPGTAASMFASGNYNHMPVILGSTEYELKPFLPLYGATIPTSSGKTWFNVYNALGVIPPPLTLAELMPSAADQFLYEACGKYPSLSWKASGVDSLARLLKEQQADVYCYFFKWGGIGSGPSPFDFLIGSGHATEIPFFFGWERDVFGLSFKAENREGRVALQRAMMSYAANFAYTGNPNGSGLPAVWEKWSNVAGAPKSIIFNANLTQADISMMNQEITKADVLAQVNSLPPAVKAIAMMFMFF